MNAKRPATFKHKRVVTCDEASLARGVPLNQELKSILLKSNEAIMAVHLCGNHRVNSKEIKRVLNSKHLRFLNGNELKYFGLKPGLVNPWNIDFCTKNFVCKRIFENDFMTTNNGCFTEGIMLYPIQLLELRGVNLGVYSCH